MTDTNRASSTLALSAALAIIKHAGNPARWDRAKLVTAGDIAAIIQGEMNHTVVVKAIKEAMAEIQFWHGDMLTQHQRNHPCGSGWAQVYDKLAAARELLEASAA
jgi:hypothetical protein